MSNGEVCCILGVCCPPGSAAQFEHLVEMIQKARPKMDVEQAHRVALKVLEAHDHFKGVRAIVDEAAPES